MNLKVPTFLVALELLLISTYIQTNNSQATIIEQTSSSINYSSSSPSVEPSALSSVIEDEPIDNPLRKTVSIYLNPSVQVHNLYVGNLGNEATNMRDIAVLMKDELEDIYYIDLEGNFESNGLSLSKSVAKSNSKKRDIHLALHSNAGGGQGTEIYTKGSDKSFASTIYEGVFKLRDLKRRGIKDGTHLYEVKSCQATHVALLEIAFHDNLDEAKFIVDNKAKIAKQLVSSILEYIDYYYPLNS